MSQVYTVVDGQGGVRLLLAWWFAVVLLLVDRGEITQALSAMTVQFNGLTVVEIECANGAQT